MLEAIVIFSFLIIAYAYFGYPLVLYALNPPKDAKMLPADLETPQSVSVIITVKNEEAVIEDKLNNTLEAVTYFKNNTSGKAKIIVASDASTDDTDKIVKRYRNKGVSLVTLKDSGGKEKAQKAALSKADSEIIVFTDAKVKMDENALVEFCQYFRHSNIGAVSSIDRIETEDGQTGGEGIYLRYEMGLRVLESKFNSLVGLTGALFAVRKDIALRMRDNIPSDFSLLLETVRAGKKGVHADNIPCRYKSVKTEKEEFTRKVRTVLRGMTALFSTLDVLNPFHYGAFAWQIFSHKLCRWLVPWFLITGTVGVFYLSNDSMFYLACSILLCAFYVLAFLGYKDAELCEKIVVKVPTFFTIANLAIAASWIKYLKGERKAQWTPSRR